MPTVQEYQKMLEEGCPYKICDGSGLIPFRNKEGKVIPNCWVYCQCHQDEPEHEHRLNPGDFDYSTSDTFRAWSFEHCGLADHGFHQPETTRPAPIITNAPIESVDVVDLRKQHQLLLAQMRFLQNKVTEMRAKGKKSRGKY